MQAGKDYIGIGVVFFCHDGHGKVVMSKRGKNARDEQGMWDIGGGAYEFGDTVEHTLKKEIKEEYGTDVLSYEFLGFRDVKRTQEGKKTHWLTLDYAVRIDPDKIKNGEPHKLDAVKLFPVSELPDPKHSQLPTFLALYKSKLAQL